MTTQAGRWAAATASVRGSAHDRDGRPNQDAVRVVEVHGATPGLIAAVCDGHGGSRYVRSDIGSRLGAEVACEVGRRALAELGISPTPAAVHANLAGPVAETILERWRERVIDDARTRPFTDAERSRAGVALDGDPFVSYGCTLLLAVISQQWIGFLQIGDGDVTVVQNDRVQAPVPTDDRLVGGETTSLCLPTAVADARISVLSEPLPSVIILTSDGYANSFASPRWRTDAGIDLRDQVHRLGLDQLEQRLPGWLAESATAGGDDVSMALIARTDDIPPTMIAQPIVHASESASPVAAAAAVAARPRNNRALVAGGVGIALLVGVVSGWALGRNNDSTSPAAGSTGSTEFLTSSTIIGAVSTTTTPTPTTRSGSSITALPTTTSTAEPTTTATPPNDQTFVLLGGTQGFVITFDPNGVASDQPRLLQVVGTTDRPPSLPVGWAFSGGALTFEGRCHAAIAYIQAGYKVWAVGPDRATLSAYDPNSGDLTGEYPISGATVSTGPTQDPCSAAVQPTAPNSSVSTANSSPSTSTSTSTSLVAKAGSTAGTAGTTSTTSTGNTITTTTTNVANG